MVEVSFEHEGDHGLLVLTTHFEQMVIIPCSKHTDEIFRLGGTAINEVVAYEGILDFKIPMMPPYVAFKAFRTPELTFEGMAILSDEIWNDADTHCYITEYYELDMEDKKPTWFASKNKIKDADRLFVNVDVLDGGENIIKRYRVSPFTGKHVVLTW